MQLDSPTDIVIVGAGGHAVTLAAAVRASGGRVVAFVASKAPPSVMDIVVHDIPNEEIASRFGRLAVGFLGIGPEAMCRRLGLMESLRAHGASVPAIVHPRAHVDEDADCEDGTQIMCHAYVGPRARIGFGAVVNTSAVVEHDATVGAGCTIAPGAIVLGGVELGRCCFVGAGAVVIQGAIVPEHTMIKANSIWK